MKYNYSKILFKDYKVKLCKFKNCYFIKINGKFGSTNLKLKKNIKIIGEQQKISFLSDFIIVKTLISKLKQNIKGSIFGWYTKLELCSRNYSSYRMKGEDSNFFLLNLGYSHRFRLSIPKNMQVYCRRKVVLICSSDKVKLYNFANTICYLKPLDLYTGKGIKFFNEKIILKPGKQSQFK